MASPISISSSDDQIERNAVKIPLKVIKLAGQLDESNVDDTARQVYEIMESMEKGNCLAFDLSALTYLNSKSIGYLTDWHLKMREKEGQIFIVSAQDNILDILNVVGLTQIVKNYESLEACKSAS